MPQCLKDIMATHPLYTDFYAFCNAIIMKIGFAAMGIITLGAVLVL